MNKALWSSENQNWCTPMWFFEQLDNEFHFALDAAATEKSAKCKRFFTPETDGLKKSWDVGGTVFVNPPYGRTICQWIAKAYAESKNGVTVVMLLPARTDTAYFHDYILGKAEIRFIRGRLCFTDEYGNPRKDKKGKPMNAPFPSMVCIFNGKLQRGDEK